MKHLLTALLLFLAVGAFGQASLSDLKTKKVAWLGIDFSLGKFIGKSGFNDMQNIKDYYFGEWNQMTVSRSKSDLMNAMKLKDLDIFLDPVFRANDGIKITEYIQNEMHRIKEEDVKSAISNYDLSSCEAEIAVCFHVEFFSKLMESTSIFVSFLDVSSKEVFFIKRIDAEAGGIGFKPHWFSAINRTIHEVGDNFKKWKKGKGDEKEKS